MFSLMYAWWEARNKANAGEQCLSAEEIAHRATMMGVEVSSPKQQGAKKNNSQKREWYQPPCDKLIINCDGAYLQSEGKGGWHFVLKNHDGELFLQVQGAYMMFLTLYVLRPMPAWRHLMQRGCTAYLEWC